jgi:hypothetical protein
MIQPIRHYLISYPEIINDHFMLTTINRIRLSNNRQNFEYLLENFVSRKDDLLEYFEINIKNRDSRALFAVLGSYVIEKCEAFNMDKPQNYIDLDRERFAIRRKFQDSYIVHPEKNYSFCMSELEISPLSVRSIFRDSERYIPVLGALPRMINAIYCFIVCFFYTIIHAIPSMRADWDTERVLDITYTELPYHATYRNFYLKKAWFFINDLVISSIIVIPIVGQIFAICLHKNTYSSLIKLKERSCSFT